MCYLEVKLMKKIHLMLIILIVSTLLLASCQEGSNMKSIGFLEDKDNKLADICINNLCDGIKEKDKTVVKKTFSEKACSDAGNIEAHIDELFEFINGEFLSWDREESPIVEDYAEAGKKAKREMFWFSLRTSEELYSVFLSYYPIENINPNNKGIYSMLIIKDRDENTLEGSIDEWSTAPGIKIQK